MALPGLSADTIYLWNGARIEGDVVDQSAAEVVVRNAQGERRLSKAWIRRIEYEDLRKQAEEVRQQEVRRRRQEEADRQEAEKKRIADAERQAAEHAREKEEQQRLREKQEVAEQEREKERLDGERERTEREAALRRRGLRVGLTLGGATLRPASEALWGNFRKLSNIMSPDRAFGAQPSMQAGAGGALSLLCVWNRLSLTLEGSGSSHSGSNSEIFYRSDTSGQITQEFPAFHYRRIVRSSGEARLGFDFWTEPRYRFQVFGGVRREVVTIRGQADGAGTVSGGSVPEGIVYLSMQNISGGSALSGGEAGLGSWHRLGQSRPFEMEFRVGAFQGEGTSYYNVHGVSLGQSAWSERGLQLSTKSRGTGGFAAATFLWPVAPHLDIGMGMSYESLMLAPRSLDFFYGKDMGIDDFLGIRMINAVLNGLIQEQLKARESQAILGLSVRYRLDL